MVSAQWQFARPGRRPPPTPSGCLPAGRLAARSASRAAATSRSPAVARPSPHLMRVNTGHGRKMLAGGYLQRVFRRGGYLQRVFGRTSGFFGLGGTVEAYYRVWDSCVTFVPCCIFVYSCCSSCVFYTIAFCLGCSVAGGTTSYPLRN